MKIEELLFETIKQAMAEFSKVAGPEKAKLKIDKFVELKNKNQFKDPIEKDINHWRRLGWEEFSQMIDKKSKVASDTQIKRGKVVGNAIMLRDDAEWKVLIPLDKEASVYHGKGTQWCTTRPQDSYYERYVYENNGTLIYAIDQAGSGDRSVAILIKSDGNIDRFSKEDDPIGNTEYTEISGLDPTDFIKQAQLPENKAQTDKSREIYHKARKDTAKLLAVQPINVAAIEEALKLTKHGEDCNKYIIAYSTEQKKRVSVHPFIIAAAANYVGSSPKPKVVATELGEHIDFSKIPNATMKSALRMSPELFIHNIDLLSDEQKSLLTSSPKSAFTYALEVLGKKRFPEGEAVIATSAEYAAKYAYYILKPDSSTNGRFPAGEKEIATDAYYSYFYARLVLDNTPFPAGEPSIAKNARYSVRYAMEILKNKRFPAGETAIARNVNSAVDYAVNVLKKPWPAAEKVIATDSDSAITYSKLYANNPPSESWENLIKNNPKAVLEYMSATKTSFPAGMDAIKKDAQASYSYAVNRIGGRFLEGEPAIAASNVYAHSYFKDILKYKRVKDWEQLIKKYPMQSYEYARDIKAPFPLGEKAIATSAQYSIQYATEVLGNKPFPLGEKAIATNATASFAYAHEVLKNNRFPAGEAAIASDGANAYFYAKFVLKRPFPKGNDAIMKSEYANDYREFLSTVAPGIKRDNRNQQVAGKVAFPILPPNVVKTTEYFMGNYDDTPEGPFSSSDIFRLMKMHHIKPTEKLIWRKGLTSWITLAELLPELDPTNYKRKNQPADNQVAKSKTELIEEEEIYYYVINDAKRGPVTKTYLHKLLTDNLINSHTFVWRPGMKGWQELSAVMKEITPVKTEGRYTQRRNINAYNIRR